MSQIRDMLYVKNIERQLGRELTKDELNSEEPFRVVLMTGDPLWVEIPVLSFPYDLLSKPQDIFVSELFGLDNVA